MSALLEITREEIQPAPSEQAQILKDFQDAVDVALSTCPPEFHDNLMKLAFAGQQLIVQARITAELAAAKKAFDREIQIHSGR